MNSTALTALCLAAGLAVAVPALAQPSDFDPNDPAKSGYRLVFDSRFNTPAGIDWDDLRTSGFDWYRGTFFGHKPTQAADISIRNGVLTLSGADGTQLATAAPAPGGQGWVGRAFGGGAFIEAQLAFDPAQQQARKQWPAFWSMAIEHMANPPPGAFEHFMEDDFFEDDTAANTYGGALHDWFGVYQKTCPGRQYCEITNDKPGGPDNYRIRVPPETDWRQFHDYAQLWTPSAPGHPGAIQYFFDGAPTTDRVTWTQGAPFSVIDQDHMVIILSTGGGQEMYVREVRIWQKTSEQDESK